MSEDFSTKELDYNMILMNHINRLGLVTTSNFVEMVAKEDTLKYINPKTLGEKSLSWGCHFLYSIIPDDLLDSEFEEEKKVYTEMEDSPERHFRKLKAIINLLHRKGFLTSETVSGRRYGRKGANYE